MNIKAIILPGTTEITVHGLVQWDYGRKLEIHASDLPGAVEVHFACAGMKEAVVRRCVATNGVFEAVIPDSCLEQTSPVYAWVYIIDEAGGATAKTIIMPVLARTQPQQDEDIPRDTSDAYTQFVAEINAAVTGLKGGDVTVNHANTADHASTADSATTATTAETANTAQNAGHADTARRAEYANNADWASNGTHATYSDIADRAYTAGKADTATEAQSATLAAHAEYADSAGHASKATAATSANYAEWLDYGGAVYKVRSWEAFTDNDGKGKLIQSCRQANSIGPDNYANINAPTERLGIPLIVDYDNYSPGSHGQFIVQINAYKGDEYMGSRLARLDFMRYIAGVTQDADLNFIYHTPIRNPHPYVEMYGFQIGYYFYHDTAQEVDCLYMFQVKYDVYHDSIGKEIENIDFMDWEFYVSKVFEEFYS